MKRNILALVMGVLALIACKAKSPQADAPNEVESPTLSITAWSARTELFMEYPPLVSGTGAAFAVHLTDLRSFRPLSEGKAIIELEKDAKVTRFESKGTSRPGIFRVDATPGGPGPYRARLRVSAPKLEDLHELGDVLVHESKAAALAKIKPEGQQDEAIRFLKEQQWGSEFATEVAVPRRIQETLQVPAIVRPRGGGEGSAISPVRGRVLPSPRLPLPGQRVQQGEVVASIAPFTATPQDPAGLRLELAQAETDLAQARQQRTRLEALLQEHAIPARRVDEMKAEEARAQARVEAARARIAQFDRTRSGVAGDDSNTAPFQVRAPLGGIVTTLSAVPGGAVEAGQELVHIVAVDRVWVVAEVPEAHSGALVGLQRAEIGIPGTAPSIHVPGSRGKIEHIAPIVHPESRRIPVILDVSNRDGLFRIGQSLSVRLGSGEAVERVSVPVSSIVDDGGRSVVFVQIAGESFQRRTVRTGSIGQGYQQVLDGVQPGERVVSKGAYSIRLAALSTQIPAHGHVH